MAGLLNMNSIYRSFAICISIFLFALAFRLYHISQESFFIDEVSTWKAAHTPAIEYAKNVEVNPPLYFAMVRIWATIMDSPDGLRVFSALTGALCAVFLLLAAREMGCGWTGAIGCSLLAAANPMLVWYGQQARCYALLSTLVAAWIWANLWALRQPRLRRLFVIFLILILGFSVHYYFGFAVVGGAIFAAIVGLRRHAWRRIAFAHASAFAAWLAYVPLVRYQLTQNHISWIPRPQWSDLPKTYLESFLVGPFHSLAPRLMTCLLLLALLVVSCMIWSFIRSRRSSIASSHRDSFAMSFVIISAIAPVLIPFFLSLGSHSFFLRDRYTIVALPAFLLAIICVVERIRFLRLQQAAIFGLMAILLPLSIWMDMDYWSRCQDFDWRGSARVVENNWQEGDRLLFIPSWMGETFSMNSNRKDLPVLPLGQVAEHPASRIWVFGWIGTPESKEKQFIERLASPLAEIKVDYPHIKLWLRNPEGGLAKQK